MTKIKLCGLTRLCDISAVNNLKPEYAGFVFARKSRRYITAETAQKLKERLNPEISAVGVFVDSPPEEVAKLLKSGIIDIAQLHGSETDGYISELRKLTNKPVIKAFCVFEEADVKKANSSTADFVLLDSEGGGSGKIFDYGLLGGIKRQYFLAGGLNAENAEKVIKTFAPFAVDVSSGIETAGQKDAVKMERFVRAVRRADGTEV